MSIDALVVGANVRPTGECVLVLEPREESNKHHGDFTMVVMKPPKNKKSLGRLIGCELWGGSGELLLGDTKIAERVGYRRLTLLPGWESIVNSWRKRQKEKKP